jgi:hypothetical protein
MQYFIQFFPVVGLVIALCICAISVPYLRSRGYVGFGGDTVVRCISGHLFTTKWIPGVSFKSVRLGLIRLQYCPVGRHWTFVVPVKESDLTEEEKQVAADIMTAKYLNSQ